MKATAVELRRQGWFDLDDEADPEGAATWKAAWKICAAPPAGSNGSLPVGSDLTSPEHYRRAEDLLASISETHPAGEFIAMAQVHATLAAALNDGSGGMGAHDYEAWRQVAAVRFDDQR